MSHTSARSANLLGSVGLAVSDRIRAAGEQELGIGGSAPSSIVARSTYLEDQPLDVISSVFVINPSAVVRLVDRLEGEGLVERRPGPDKRRVSVRLTPAGDRRARAILDRREQALGNVLGALTEDVRAAGRVCRFCDVHACGHYEGRCPVTRGIDARGLRG